MAFVLAVVCLCFPIFTFRVKLKIKLATRPDGHYLANQCRAWAEALDGFTWLPITDTSAAAGTAQLVTAVRESSGLADAEVYVAGPEAFVNGADFEFRAAGVPADSLSTLAL